MRSWIEQYLNQALKEVYGEGGKIVKIKALSVALQAIQGTRRVLILNYVAMSACFIWALSFFSAALLVFYRFSHGEFLAGPGALAFSAGLLAISTLALHLTVRERAWLSAFEIQEKIDALNAPAPEPEPKPLSAEDVVHIVDQLLDDKLARLAQQQAAAAQSNVTPLKPENTETS